MTKQAVKNIREGEDQDGYLLEQHHQTSRGKKQDKWAGFGCGLKVHFFATGIAHTADHQDGDQYHQKRQD